MGVIYPFHLHIRILHQPFHALHELQIGIHFPLCKRYKGKKGQKYYQDMSHSQFVAMGSGGDRT